MTVSGFFDESGKFKDHRITSIGCVAAFNQHVEGFAHEWGLLLAANGMKQFHATKALKHHVPLGAKQVPDAIRIPPAACASAATVTDRAPAQFAVRTFIVRLMSQGSEISNGEIHT